MWPRQTLMGAVWRARDGEGEVLMEHRVGPHFLTDDGMGVDFTQLQNYPEWVPNRGPADNEGASPRFPRTMINAAAGRLEVYARMEDGREGWRGMRDAKARQHKVNIQQTMSDKSTSYIQQSQRSTM